MNQERLLKNLQAEMVDATHWIVRGAISKAIRSARAQPPSSVYSGMSDEVLSDMTEDQFNESIPKDWSASAIGDDIVIHIPENID